MKQNIWYDNKSIRLKEYDYSHPGSYFVTIYIKDGKCIFGEVVKGKMVLNKSGKIADAFLSDIPNHFPETEILKHIVMPNHVHAIINIFEKDDAGQTHAHKNKPVGQTHAFDLQVNRKHEKLPVIIGSYKSAVSKEIHKINSFFKWQVSFHDHIIRNDKALANICQYIEQNLENWEEDLENEKYLSSITANEREKRLKRFYKKLTE